VHDHLELLSPREREVLSMVVGGKPTKQIASILGLSHKTVDNHRANILEKMGAGGVVDLVRLTLLADPGFREKEHSQSAPQA
jgi:two-component system response regulator FixJ